ncbi:AAA family ATPase [Dialister sp.]|uniref:AAA family ATPase n=1 Tax=Dialister sp. TaxID=1955814 RepID=UPI002E806195|nr:AAA family ATPase [Dialister sp.]MEE3453172.1 AAA family ATPase [Dialister sp.]
MRKRLGVGIDLFSVLRENNCYYVDKTDFVRQVAENMGSVLLYTRPRRFGKTLAMSTLKEFFRIGAEPALFEGLKVAEDKAFCEKYFGKYPVIFISLKGVDGLTYESAFNAFTTVIGREADRFSFLTESDRLSNEEKKDYLALTERDETKKTIYGMSQDVLMGSLKTLTGLLEKHYGQKPVVLIDEYDVPLDKAYIHGYYDQMVSLIRNLFHNAFKTNENLAFAVMTGCLRVSKESIFTGLNNLKVNTIASPRGGEYFGFTDSEVKDLLSYFDLSGCKDNVKAWYDGYRFGNAEIYCPWDVINYVDDVLQGGGTEPANYWANSSGNDLVRRFVDLATEQTSDELESLVQGETVKKKISETLTYRELEDSIDNVWSVLYTTGYLTGCSEGDGMFKLWIPNSEVRQIFEDDIISWFHSKVKQDTKSGARFYNAAMSGNPREMEIVLNQLLFSSVSIRDTYARKGLRETFYHGFVLGLLSQFQGVRSNSEAGNGYSDIILSNVKESTAAILELKYADSDDVKIMEKACQGGLQQIEEKKYDVDILRSGVATTIYKYGISFHKKFSCVRLAGASLL